MEELQAKYEILIAQMNLEFEAKLALLNKRYHVIEANLKKLKPPKAQKTDIEFKLQAKIFSLEKQLEAPRLVHNVQQSIQPNTILYQLPSTLISNNLFAYVDNILPLVIEILPLQSPLLAQLTLQLYDRRDQQERDEHRSTEQHVNDVMLSQGQKKCFEISFVPKTDYWKKIMKSPQPELSSFQLVQSPNVQAHIVKLMKDSLNDTYSRVIRQGYSCKDQKPLLEQRIDSVTLILMLTDSEDDHFFAFNNLQADFQINPVLTRYLNQKLAPYKTIVDSKNKFEIIL